MIPARWLFPAALAAATLGCSAGGAASRPGAPASGATLRIATWNIAWLTERDGRGARDAADYTALRRHAAALDADIIALQEVDGDAAARRVFDASVYDLHFTADADNVQRTGFAWKKSLVVRRNPDVESLAIRDKRPGADITVTLPGGEALRLLAVHLKSGCADRPLGSKDDACAILAAQLPALEAWIDARAAEGIAFAVLGDFNRGFEGPDPFWLEIDDGDPPQADLLDAGAGQRPACWNGRHGRYIDHIVLSPRAARRLVAGSFHEAVYDAGSRAGEPGLSDHCPLSVLLRAGEPGDTGTAPPRLAAREAVAHVGELATVCGRVASARYVAAGSGLTFLNLEAPHPAQAFTVVIRRADRAAFGRPEVDLDGKFVCVTGTVELYRGKPQIVARTPDQIVPGGVSDAR